MALTERDQISSLLPKPLFESVRLTLAGAAGTTLRVARFDRSHFSARVIAIEPPSTLLRWCGANRVEHAMIGGFYVRPGGPPLGSVRIGGRDHPTRPFDPPWGALRACIHAEDGRISLTSRQGLPAAPAGDLLQAGPMLVGGGASLIRPGEDLEGFSAGASQFDSDITVGRYPRAALGLEDGNLVAVVSEGRTDKEAGLTLAELAEAMIGLGCIEAINLDGGGSASLVVDSRLCNTPREEHGREIAGGREIATALQFVAR